MGGHIDMLFVRLDYHRKGVATALLNCVEARARQNAMQYLFTHASIPAQNFFEKFGFKTLKAQSITIKGQTLINFQMEKYL